MNADMMEKVLDQLAGDMDDLEGSAAMAHSLEDCPDPLSCKMHDSETGEPLAKEGDGKMAGVEIEVKPIGVPSMDGAKEEGQAEKAEDGLSPEEAEELDRLLKK